MIAELGNFFVVVPYMLILALGVVCIMIALGDRKKGRPLPNVTARRKHPLRHLQVEVNRARKEAREAARAAKDENGDDAEQKPRTRRRRRDDGPRHLRRL